jgi:hypothetical protein
MEALSVELAFLRDSIAKWRNATSFSFFPLFFSWIWAGIHQSTHVRRSKQVCRNHDEMCRGVQAYRRLCDGTAYLMAASPQPDQCKARWWWGVPQKHSGKDLHIHSLIHGLSFHITSSEAQWHSTEVREVLAGTTHVFPVLSIVFISTYFRVLHCHLVAIVCCLVGLLE